MAPETTAFKDSMFMAALRQRCPACRQGRLFSGIFTMNEVCPTCGLRFEREQGYFLGAMYFSYFLSVAVLSILFTVLLFTLENWPSERVSFLAALLFLPIVPVIFRYSRVVWIYFDRWAWPSGPR